VSRSSYTKAFQTRREVGFRLHVSTVHDFAAIDKPPYQVTETGWGEFEVNVKIHFVDGSERPVKMR
jgi:YEATS domain-containing protein 4